MSRIRDFFHRVGSTLWKPLEFIGSKFKSKPPPKTPVVGFTPRLKNIARNNFRGLIGCIPAICILSWQSEKNVHSKTVELMWMWMFWFALTHPVAIPILGLIPIFLLPMTGVMPTVAVCLSYMNENVVLFLITGMLILLLNNSGVDRRLALWFICSGDACQFSAKRLVFKASSAAFFLSMFSSRLISTAVLIQYVTPALIKMKASAPKGGPDFDEIRYILNNAIQTSAGIGSTAIMHSSYVNILFKAIFSEAPTRDKEFPDIFNYLQYSAFAFPVAFITFLLNVSYHMLLINWFIEKPMTAPSMSELQTHLMKYKAELPRRVSLHEKLSILFHLFYLLMFFFRWGDWIEGWAKFNTVPEYPLIPKIKDATPAAIFLIALHILPKGYGFLKFLDAEKKSQLPPLKPESSILWWRFVDKNINYGYFFIFGAGITIMNAARDTGLGSIISENLGRGITEKRWDTGIFLVVFLTSILANVMSCMAVCAIFLPLVMCMCIDGPIPWASKSYCGALGVGIASNFGFCIPFQYTPAYYCHNNGKVPIKKMIKYSFLSVWICLIILWYALTVWAPYLYDPGDNGIVAVPAPPPPGAPTTPAPEEGGGGGGGGEGGGGEEGEGGGRV